MPRDYCSRPSFLGPHLPPHRQAPQGGGLRLHLPPGMQHEVPMQLAKVVEGILAFCTVVGAALVLVLLPSPPSCWALPSPRRLLLFLPEGPAFRHWRFLGGCSGAAEPAGWGAWWGLPEG